MSLQSAAVCDDVKDKLHQSALSLSGGQQQRVCIARVLAVKPDIILLDEPTSALDPISSSKVEDTMLRLREDYTIITVTHNMQQASRISGQTAFFLNGGLIEADKTRNIFLNPKEKQTEGYICGKFGEERRKMRSTFEEQLTNLHLRFSEMRMMASEAIKKSVKAYIDHDKALAKDVIQHDHVINKREMDLEKESFEMIALQQPVTADLRMIVTVLKASSDLERMGDHAVSIA